MLSQHLKNFPSLLNYLLLVLYCKGYDIEITDGFIQATKPTEYGATKTRVPYSEETAYTSLATLWEQVIKWEQVTNDNVTVI